MGIEDIRRRATRLGIKNVERLNDDELNQAMPARGITPGCFNQPLCRPIQYHECYWKKDCKADLEPAQVLVLSDSIITGNQVAKVLSASFGWNTRIVHSDKQAYNLILDGDIHAIVADIVSIDQGGLAVLVHAKRHWPSIRTFAITENGDYYIKKLARDMGGCEGFFYRVRGRMKLDTKMRIGPSTDK